MTVSVFFCPSCFFFMCVCVCFDNVEFVDSKVSKPKLKTHLIIYESGAVHYREEM